MSNISERVDDISIDEIKAARVLKIDNAVKEKTEEISDLERTLGVVENRCRTKLEASDSFDEICSDIKAEIKRLQDEISELISDKTELEKEIRDGLLWVKKLSQSGKISDLNRRTITNLVDKIYVYEDKRIEIRFNFGDQLRELINLCKANAAEVV